MFRKVILLTCFVLAMGTGALYAAPFQQSTGPDAIVAMEAEHYTAKVAASNRSWEPVGPTGGFTGAAGMRALPDGGTNINTGYVTNSPHMDYEVEFKTVGKYYVWVRAWGPDGSGDSCHASLDGQVIATSDRITSSAWTNAYGWTNATADNAPATFDVATAGIHVVNIYMREDGLIVDKILLTTNPAYTPTGDGPPENPLIAYGPKPANGAIEVTDSVVEWIPSASAVSHKVYLSKDQTIDAADFVAETPATLQIVVLDPDTKYYWRVDEVQPDGSTAQGDVWSFTTMSLLAHFPDPSDGRMWVRLDAKLSWAAGQKAILHNVYLGTNAAALAPVAMMQLPTSFTPAKPLNPNTTYYWRVDEFTPGGTQKGPVWSFKTIDPAVGGAVAEYWTNRNLDGAPAIVKIVPEVNFDWGGGTVPGTNSPDPAIPVDNFSCRWSAELQVPVTGTYTLYEASDDGARMFLNGVQVATGWYDRGTTEDKTAAMELVAGQRYLLVMEMYENGGGATAYLRWEGPGYAKDIIPQGALMPPQMAFSLSPRDGATGVAAVPVLSWLAGDTAVTFNVYFGTDSAAVAAGDASVLLAQQAEKSLALTSALTWGGKYYWKVDAVRADGTVLPGLVSSFTVTDRIVLENFESYDVTPVEPNAAGLVGWWQFDGNLNSVGGKGQTGVPTGTIGFETDPVRGQVLDLPGGDNQFVALGGVGISGNMRRTIAVWAKADNTNIPDWTLVFGFTGDAAGNGGNGSHFDIDSLGGPGGVGAHVWGWEETIFTDQQALEWRHYAMSYDGTTIQYYGDGKLVDTDPGKSNVRDLAISADRVHVGKRITQASSFPGNVDDARIYNYTLSPAEVAGVAGLAATNPLTNAWISSGTAVAVLTLSGPHGGAKAMSIQYQNNVAPFLGEVSAVPSITDMTLGAGSLLLWVRGDSANGADPIYVSLQDSAGATATVANSDPLAAQDGIWSAWIIPLNKFTGVNLASVAKLIIGIGNGQPGGTGAIRIDDISLVKPVVILAPADVTAPGDDLRGVPNDGDWPGAEYPALAIDNNVNTKFLHFKGDIGPSGIQVTPSGPQSIVTGLTFTTANDTPGRDPVAYELYGSNVGINGPYTLIAAGPIVDFNQPAEWPRFTKNTTPITFTNTVAYDHYQVIFPRIRGPVGGGVNSMQIAEIELIGTVGVVAKPKIIWVSDNKTPTAAGVPADQAWVDLLVAQGYEVDLSFRNKEGRTLDDAKIAALNAADLIIISRDTNSSDYDDGQEVTQWNSITAPVLMQVAQIAQSSRWRWINIAATNNAQPAAMQAVVTTHPIFSGVTLDASNQVGVITTNVSFVSTADAGNGTLIASRADNGQVWIAEWQAGLAYYASSTQTPAGHRMLFTSGGTGAPVTDGTYNLTPEGEKMFLNAVAYMAK